MRLKYEPWQSEVGLAEALINFTKTFSPNEPCRAVRPPERDFFIDNLLVRIRFIIVMIR